MLTELEDEGSMKEEVEGTDRTDRRKLYKGDMTGLILVHCYVAGTSDLGQLTLSTWQLAAINITATTSIIYIYVTSIINRSSIKEYDQNK